MDRRTLLGAALLPVAGRAFAQGGWPDRVLRIVVPFAPGSFTDVVGAAAGERADRAARPVGDRGESRRRRQHRRHARGRARRARWIHAAAHRQFAFDIARPLSESSLRSAARSRADQPHRRTRPRSCWCGRAWTCARSPTLVALRKQEPERLTFGSGGPGSSAHLAMELLLDIAGIRALHVPFRGVAAAIAEMIAGRVDMAIASLASGVAHVQSARSSASA